MSRRCYSFPSWCVVGLSNSAAQEGLHMQSLWSSGRTKRKNGECIYRSIHTSKPACERAVIFTLRVFYSTSSVNSATNVNPPNVTVFVCSLFGSIQEEVVKDAESVRNQQQQHLQQHSCTLDECFQLYTKEEQVGNSSWTFMKTVLAHFSSFLTDSFTPSPKFKIHSSSSCSATDKHVCRWGLTIGKLVHWGLIFASICVDVVCPHQWEVSLGPCWEC